MKAHCPCCGQSVPDLPRLDELAVACGLTGDVSRVFWILAASRGRYMTPAQVGEVLWMDRKDGGPLSFERSIYTLICRLRAALAGYPVAIEHKGNRLNSINAVRLTKRWTVDGGRKHGHYSGYQLTTEDRIAA